MVRFPPVRPTRRAEYEFIAVVDYYKGIGGMSGGCKDDTHNCYYFCWTEEMELVEKGIYVSHNVEREEKPARIEGFFIIVSAVQHVSLSLHVWPDAKLNFSLCWTSEVPGDDLATSTPCK